MKRRWWKESGSGEKKRSEAKKEEVKKRGVCEVKWKE